MSELNKLLPCPFCGGEAGNGTVYKGRKIYPINHKQGCLLELDYYVGEDQITAWNTRTPRKLDVGKIKYRIPSFFGNNKFLTLEDKEVIATAIAEAEDIWEEL